MKKLIFFWGIASICFPQDVTLWVCDADLSTIQICMTNTEDVYGFQFDIVADEQFAPTSFSYVAGVGTALGAGFIVQTSNSGRVIGFSLVGASIPVGSGTLVEVTWNPIDVEGFVTLEIANFAGEAGIGLSFANGDPFLLGGVIGCTDYEACNFNPEATYDDGTCYYPFSYWEDIDGDGIGAVFLGQFCPEEIPDGAVDIFGDNCPFVYNPDQIDIDGNGIGDICQEGCTDPSGINYDPYSAIDDGSCYYFSDLDPYFQPIELTIPYFPMGIYLSSALINGVDLRIGDEVAVYDGDTCLGSVQLASEIVPYVPIIISQDNPNTPDIDGFISGNILQFRFWDESEQIEVININVEVTNGTNLYNPLGFAYVNLSVTPSPGCINPIALNYNPEANYDDGSCILPILGCTDVLACNFNTEANVEDGSCLYDDCNDDCGGEALTDLCGECVGGNTGVEPLWAADCNGDCYGSALLDLCGDCTGGHTGLEVNYNMDCAFLCYGTAFIDECGECVGGSTGIEPLWAMDCNNDCFGDATIDDCGDCVGGNTGLEYNYNIDCASVCYGYAYFDDCGVCDDEAENDNACIGCMDPWAVNYDPFYTIDDGSCEYPGYGDLIPDGSLNVLDVVALVEHIMEEYPYLEFMDLNYDGFINVIDVVIIVDIILNPESLGCTDPDAGNYNPEAVYENGECEYSGIIELEWSYVPEGEYMFGVESHLLNMNYSFFITTHEISFSEYSSFLNSAYSVGIISLEGSSVLGYYAGDQFWDEGIYPYISLNNGVLFDGEVFFPEPGLENNPVVFVTYPGAVAMANFYITRIPSNNEWEKASRGNHLWLYPWGNDYPDCSQANYDDCYGYTLPVGTMTGQSPFGCLDMIGNVWEWSTGTPDNYETRTIRGGSFGYALVPVFFEGHGATMVGYYNVGFRLVKDVD